MKNLIKIVGLLVVLLLPTKAINAQHLFMETNKQIYVAGEELRFKCTLTNPGQYANSILYVDVCGEGYHITSKLLKPANNEWDSYIQLPDTMQTGVYLLRAYIGNQQGKPIVVAQPVSVINRFMNADINTKRRTKPRYLALDRRGIPKAVNNEFLTLQLNTTAISTNQDFKLTVSNKLNDLAGNITLKIYKVEKELTATVPNMQFQFYTPSESVHIYNHLVLSGRITETSNHKTVEDETVLLSIPDSIPSVHYAFTGSNGEFKFVLDNLDDQQDIIIQTLNKKRNLTIEIHPFLLLPPKKIPYYIPEEVEQSSFVQLAIKRETMHQAFMETVEETPQSNRLKIPFYGHTETRVYPGRFVPLVDFAEIAWEILPTVRYKNTKDSTYLTIWNPNSEGFYDTPWTLVDGIPVYDLSQINQLNSDKIKWIDIQPEVRCYGSIMIKGLIDIQTKTGNFTELELPKNAVRTTIETFYKGNNIKNSDKFVFKDVLYWNGELSAEKSEQQITLSSSNEKGYYVAVAQAYNKNGKTFRAVVPFQVK